MRSAAALVLLLPLVARAQGAAPDPFEITQRVASAGAPQVALMRIDQLQPAAPSAPRWGDWEQLRCALMHELKRHQDLIQRVAALPTDVSAPVLRACLMQGARAAIAIARGGAARDFLARLIWRQELPGDEMRLARLLVIESYLVERKSQNAYMLMLRYDQDYKPIDRDTAARFADALLALGREKEAVNWFSRLDDASPVKLMLRLKTNLITPDAAIAQARAALAKSGAAASHWLVLQHAAVLQNNRVLRVESLENLLQLAHEREPAQIAAAAGELWQAYVAAAQEIANQNQLLLGDEANWSDFAARRLASSPPTARAFFAALALQSNLRSTREGAQLQLVHALQASGLALAALRLYGDTARFPVGDLDPQARYLLGVIAAESGQPKVAARYWLGLNTPPTLDADEWRLRLAQALIRADAAAPGAELLRDLIVARNSLPADRQRRAMAAVQELQDAGHLKLAGELYRALIPLAAPAERREILFSLGRIAESLNDYQRSADYFLEAALLFDARSPDAFAVNARLQAAASLRRAGLKDDARNQLDWLQKNIRDAEKLEIVRREMQKL